jgi:hypothetical protein
MVLTNTARPAAAARHAGGRPDAARPRLQAQRVRNPLNTALSHATEGRGSATHRCALRPAHAPRPRKNRAAPQPSVTPCPALHGAAPLRRDTPRQSVLLISGLEARAAPRCARRTHPLRPGATRHHSLSSRSRGPPPRGRRGGGQTRADGASVEAGSCTPAALFDSAIQYWRTRGSLPFH